ncbi:MAG: GNAT family N-acetyltransferase [Firmicutes bacterium]|nr:GNAT family N-acetyltransferase [Bacillota bacterium]
MEIRQATARDIPALARFMAKLNHNPAHHVGYCGADWREVRGDIGEFGLPVDKSFVVLEAQGQIRGVLGFDPDAERAWIWGPFITVQPWLPAAQALWAAMLPLLPRSITRLDFFYDLANSNALTLMNCFGAKETSREVILRATRSSISRSPVVGSVGDLPLQLEARFIQLHDSLFPGTYYSGQEILCRRNHLRRLLTCTDGAELNGYIYLEAEPESGGGSLEYIGVKPSARGRGIGLALLTSGLDWLFSFASIDKLRLCVNVENQAAIRLYQRAGFAVDRNLFAFRLFRTGPRTG